MAKFEGTTSINFTVEADTVEEVKQLLDNAIDYSILRGRGIAVTGDYVTIQIAVPDKE